MKTQNAPLRLFHFFERAIILCHTVFGCPQKRHRRVSPSLPRHYLARTLVPHRHSLHYIVRPSTRPGTKRQETKFLTPWHAYTDCPYCNTRNTSIASAHTTKTFLPLPEISQTIHPSILEWPHANQGPHHQLWKTVGRTSLHCNGLYRNERGGETRKGATPIPPRSRCSPAR